jgi:hypothetical protein
MNFRGKVLDGQGNVLLGEVAGTLESGPAGTGVQSLSGSFRVPPGSYLGPGAYRLALDDGRATGIVVVGLSSGAHEATVAHFTVSGPFA